MKENYKSTVSACFAGYVVQAIVNNFVPLLFLTFNKSYGIELSKITALITVNFILQLCIDLLSAFFIDKIGYRAAAIMAHVVRVVIQHFSKNTVISMVLGHPNSEITCIPPS